MILLCKTYIIKTNIMALEITDANFEELVLKIYKTCNG